MATDPPTQRAPSLASLIAGWPGGPIGARAAIAIVLLLTAAPVATVIGAKVLAMQAGDERAAIERREGPTLAAARRLVAQRRDLSAAIGARGVGSTLEALARTLPDGTRVAVVTRRPDGRLTMDVVTADPDRLRAALRRDPVTARLRDAGQRRGDGGLIVTLVEA